VTSTGPSDRVRVTVSPFWPWPASGDWLITRPAGTSSEFSAFAATVKPAFFRALVASSADFPV
jgi:hypothetical protein